jgi:hypothetical protein
MYNPDTDSYRLFYPSDNHEEWLPFCEVVKLLPKSWARDEEQTNTVTIYYTLTEVVADEKFSTNPTQVVVILSKRWDAGVSSRSLLFLPASNPSRASGC